MSVLRMNLPPDRLTQVTIAGPMIWAAAMLALHVLHPDNLERYGDTLSAYGVGPDGALFTIAFVALGVGIVALAFGLRRSLRPSRSADATIVLAILAGLGFILAGLFPMAPDRESIGRAIRGDSTPTTSAIIHGVGGLSGMVLLIVSMLFLSLALKRDARWGRWWQLSLAFGLATLMLFTAGFVISAQSIVPCCVYGSSGWIKALIARGLFSTLAAWLLLVALRLCRAPAVPERKN
jgi:multisubunit Na+/H+ antiporter MnhB subunit